MKFVVSEAGVQELRSGCAGAGLPPAEGQRPGVLGQRGAGVAAWRPSPCPEARQRPGATKCGGRFLFLPNQPGTHLNILIESVNNRCSDTSAAVIC